MFEPAVIYLFLATGGQQNKLKTQHRHFKKWHIWQTQSNISFNLRSCSSPPDKYKSKIYSLPCHWLRLHRFVTEIYLIVAQLCWIGVLIRAKLPSHTDESDETETKQNGCGVVKLHGEPEGNCNVGSSLSLGLLLKTAIIFKLLILQYDLMQLWRSNIWTFCGLFWSS